MTNLFKDTRRPRGMYTAKFLITDKQLTDLNSAHCYLKSMWAGHCIDSGFEKRADPRLRRGLSEVVFRLPQLQGRSNQGPMGAQAPLHGGPTWYNQWLTLD